MVPRPDPAFAVDDFAQRVHHGEYGDLRLPDLPECASLPHGRPPSRAAPAVEEPPRRRRRGGRFAKRLVRIDKAAPLDPVEDDRAGDQRQGRGTARRLLRGQEGPHAGHGFQSVQRAAGEADGMMELVLGFDHAGHAAPYVDGRDGPLVEQEDRTSRGAFVVFGESDTQAGKVELEAGGREAGNRYRRVSAGHKSSSFRPAVGADLNSGPDAGVNARRRS